MNLLLLVYYISALALYRENINAKILIRGYRESLAQRNFPCLHYINFADCHLNYNSFKILLFQILLLLLVAEYKELLTTSIVTCTQRYLHSLIVTFFDAIVDIAN